MSRRELSGPGPTATNTARSRANAALNSSADSTVADPIPRAKPASFRRPASAPSNANSNSAASPRRTASLARSNPATANPARRASPSASQQRRTRRASMRSARSCGISTGRRAARANTRFATARSTISRRDSNHKPRPGSRASISGTIVPSGPTTKRSKAARLPVSPVAIQRRCGASVASSWAWRAGAGVGAIPSPPAPLPPRRTSQAARAPS